jgi:hypothetical protein
MSRNIIFVLMYNRHKLLHFITRLKKIIYLKYEKKLCLLLVYLLNLLYNPEDGYTPSNSQWTTRRYNPEDCTLRSHCCENRECFIV